MLKLKVFANKELNLPEMILEGNNSIELLDFYINNVPAGKKNLKSKVAYVDDKLQMLRLDIKKYNTSSLFKKYAILACFLVQNNMATWLEYDIDLLDPKKAANKMRFKNVAEKRTKIIKEKYANMTPAEKKEHFSYCKNNKTDIARKVLMEKISGMTRDERRLFFKNGNNKRDYKM